MKKQSAVDHWVLWSLNFSDWMTFRDVHASIFRPEPPSFLPFISSATLRASLKRLKAERLIVSRALDARGTLVYMRNARYLVAS